MTIGSAFTAFAAATKYTVTFASVENAKWNNSNTYHITANTGYINRTIKPLSADYYIDSVFVNSEKSEGTADLTFNSNTGNVLIKNVTGDVTLNAVVKKKVAPEILEVTYSFKEGGIYSEKSSANPAVQVNFNVTVKDTDGDICPDTKVYFKSDAAERSFVSRKTDINGVASFTHSYAVDIESGHTQEDYLAQFALENDSNKILAEQNIHLVMQLKKNLVLYTNQVQASAPNSNDGKVIGLTGDKYEYFTGELHQGAIVTDSGEWQSPVNGEITNLAPGQYALRFKEYADYSSNTFYLHSDYDYFTIERGSWTVTVDEEASENVSFTETSQKVAPGDTVFFYVNADEGFEITSYFVDKPNYIESINYNDEEGFISIKGVTGSVVLTVKAEKAEIPEVTTIIEETTANIKDLTTPAKPTTESATNTVNPTTEIKEESTTVTNTENTSESKAKTTENKTTSANTKSPNTGAGNYSLSAALCLAGISALAITLKRKHLSK